MSTDGNDILKQKDIQVERLVSMIRNPKTHDEAVKEDITNRNRLLRRMFTAIAYGDLTIDGQAPDSDYQLAEYLIHGGRIFFDLSALNPKQQQEFRRWLKHKAPIMQRASATHAIGHDKEGAPMDIKTGAISAMANSVLAKAKGKPTHFGMHIHAGGYGNKIKNYEGKETTVKADGQFGHLYINDDPKHPEALQMGMEEAGALLTNQFTGDYHSATGGGGKYSAFGASRLGKEIEGDIRAPLILPESRMKNAKYNWNRVKITPENFSSIMRLENTMSNHQIREMLRAPHPQSQKVESIEDRMNAMADYRIKKGFGNQQFVNETTKTRLQEAKVKVISGKLEFSNKEPGIKQVLLASYKGQPAELYSINTPEDKVKLKKLLETHGFEIKAEGAININKDGNINVFSGILHNRPNLFNVINLKTFFDVNHINTNNTKLKTLFNPCAELNITVESQIVKGRDRQPDYFLSDANQVIKGVIEKVKQELKEHTENTSQNLDINSKKNLSYWLTAKAKKWLLRKTSGFEHALQFEKELKKVSHKIDEVEDFSQLNEIIETINEQLQYLQPEKQQWLGAAKKHINAFQDFKAKYQQLYGHIEEEETQAISLSKEV